ncbi:efflux transporter, RND family, MFP subunit [Methylocaldum marinum]|uniref:Efflux transporter, RND family, MFP subunit n=1 Tax=Methylocaldum marinum TaxID=1432792 RepID=A0A250KZG3_9GAMM|nr:efflux RND transporter periplasmic adaptor subunit [Methylocaldum marinum]BBA37068.1 efflux transporter, RND family, MFP subunit [Methylocaldum marinum]
MSRSKIVLLLIVLALTAGGFVLWYTSRQAADASAYRTVPVARGDIRQTVSANGTLNPVVLVNVGTQVSGTVQTLHADFNDPVREGQVLAELDPALFRAQLDQSRANVANARASLELAEANERRARALFGQDYISRAELDQAIQALGAAKAQLAAATAQVHRDETNLRYSVIVSPVSGVVVSRDVDIGQTVAASFQTPTLFTIAQDLKKMQIDTTVAEADVGKVRVGQIVQFAVDAFPGREFVGNVRQIRLNSQILQNVVTYNVVIDVDNPEEILMPGMTAFVNIVVDERNGVLMLPLPALRFQPTEGGEPVNPGEKRVFLLKDGSPAAVPVRIGIADGKFAELVEGDLEEGDPLITEDQREQASPLGRGGRGPGGSFRVRVH